MTVPDDLNEWIGALFVAWGFGFLVGLALGAVRRFFDHV